MGFSEDIRERLRTEAVRIEMDCPSELQRGDVASLTIRVISGNKAPKASKILLSIFVDQRQWANDGGKQFTDSEARIRSDRASLQPVWNRETVLDTEIELEREVTENSTELFVTELCLPHNGPRSTDGLSLAVHARLIVDGQIDPTDIAHVKVL